MTEELSSHRSFRDASWPHLEASLPADDRNRKMSCPRDQRESKLSHSRLGESAWPASAIMEAERGRLSFDLGAGEMRDSGFEDGRDDIHPAEIGAFKEELPLWCL